MPLVLSCTARPAPPPYPTLALSPGCRDCPSNTSYVEFQALRGLLIPASLQICVTCKMCVHFADELMELVIKDHIARQSQRRSSTESPDS